MTRVLMVTGAGRSGTSTVAGSLKLLGVHLPQPEVPADETNPRGFFETQWVVDFHKELLNRDPLVRTIDSRPAAAAYGVQLAASPDAHLALDAWLKTQLEHPQLLVKDPRAFWVHDLWRAVTEANEAELSFLTMLRHPLEVAKSRDTAYVADQDEDFRRRRVIANIAAWCNAAFVTEEVTRSDARTFVRYADLLTDWRAALAPAVEQVGLRVNTDLTSSEPHPVDDFIDSGLYRSQVTWDDTDAPSELRAIAERVWLLMNELVATPYSVPVAEELAELRVRYDRLHEDAVSIALDHTNTREVSVRRTVRFNTVREYDERLAALHRELGLARRGGLAKRAARKAVRTLRR